MGRTRALHRTAATPPAAALPSVSITSAQAEIILQQQQAVMTAQSLLNLAMASVLAGHGVSAWETAAIEGYPDAPMLRYRPRR
jgi:hypothetical protein